ncbi:hypothetical protein IWQ62_006691, partial [Dispira parvispora]
MASDTLVFSTEDALVIQNIVQAVTAHLDRLPSNLVYQNSTHRLAGVFPTTFTEQPRLTSLLSDTEVSSPTSSHGQGPTTLETRSGVSTKLLRWSTWAQLFRSTPDQCHILPIISGCNESTQAQYGTEDTGESVSQPKSVPSWQRSTPRRNPPSGCTVDLLVPSHMPYNKCEDITNIPVFTLTLAQLST